MDEARKIVDGLRFGEPADEATRIGMEAAAKLARIVGAYRQGLVGTGMFSPDESMNLVWEFQDALLGHALGQGGDG